VESDLQKVGTQMSLLDEFEVSETATVVFSAGSTKIDDEAKVDLEQIASNSSQQPGALFEVTGFASADGDATFNQILSERRASEVVKYLINEHEISPRHFVLPHGFGEAKPVADNSTIEGRKLNRRVEIRVLVNRGLAAIAQAQTR
jgi:outer membrane protein OmpA-like peptidoglycan-associated protein